MKTTLSVWWGTSLVGDLSIDEHGEMGFAYSEAWLADAARPALSHSLPKQAEPFDRREARPFFAGLLPEETQRDGVARILGLSKGNDFALLNALGGDVAGALTLWPEGEIPHTYDGRTARDPLADNALVELLDILPKRPLLAGEKGIRVSLAGAQSKLPVVLVDGRVALPAPDQPSTHIIKPAIDRLPHTTENEAFAMRLAAAMGLSVAPVELRRVGGRSYLLVTRNDREADAKGAVRRLHQEDFCQALGIAPEKKYSAEGGPTFKQGFQLVRDVAPTPAPEVLKLLDAALFNLIVGNADAHGKNYSLLYRDDGAILAPLYDLMCTAAYPDVSPKLAMKIGEAGTLDDVSPSTWPKFAKETSLGGVFVRERMLDLARAVAGVSRMVADDIAAGGFSKPELRRFSDIVDARAERLFARTMKAD